LDSFSLLRREEEIEREREGEMGRGVGIHRKAERQYDLSRRALGVPFYEAIHVVHVAA
jgi:hypothetical protein